MPTRRCLRTALKRGGNEAESNLTSASARSCSPRSASSMHTRADSSASRAARGEGAGSVLPSAARTPPTVGADSPAVAGAFGDVTPTLGAVVAAGRVPLSVPAGAASPARVRGAAGGAGWWRASMVSMSTVICGNGRTEGEGGRGGGEERRRIGQNAMAVTASWVNIPCMMAEQTIIVLSRASLFATPAKGDWARPVRCARRACREDVPPRCAVLPPRAAAPAARLPSCQGGRGLDHGRQREADIVRCI